MASKKSRNLRNQATKVTLRKLFNNFWSSEHIRFYKDHVLPLIIHILFEMHIL